MTGRKRQREVLPVFWKLAGSPQVSLDVYIPHSLQYTVMTKHPLPDLAKNELPGCYILSQFDVFSLNLYVLKIINVSFTLILQVLVRFLGLQMSPQ